MFVNVIPRYPTNNQSSIVTCNKICRTQTLRRSFNSLMYFYVISNYTEHHLLHLCQYVRALSKPPKTLSSIIYSSKGLSLCSIFIKWMKIRILPFLGNSAVSFDPLIKTLAAKLETHLARSKHLIFNSHVAHFAYFDHTTFSLLILKLAV